MAQSTNLQLPYLAAGQAQKHVTVNETLLRLDALVQLAVVSATVATEPGAPDDGALYILPAGKSGAHWGAMANGALAYYRDGAWEEIAPREGFRAWVKDAGALLAYSGAAWTEPVPAALATILAQREAGQLASFRNRLINGGFQLNQRSATSNSDDTYCLDRWFVLTESGAVAATQLTNPEAGAPYGLRLTQSQASAQRMGVAQIVEANRSFDLRGIVTTLAGRVRCSAAADIRYAVLEWTGSADSVTSDVVLDWTSASFNAGGFFLSSNLNVLATGEVTCAAATWRSLDALNATPGASANNIIVMIWTEAQAAQNVTLDLNRMQCEPGAVATPFEARPLTIERMLCERFYRRLMRGVYGQAILSSVVFVADGLAPPLRTTPAFTLLTTSPAVRIKGATTVTASSAALANQSATANGFYAQITGFSGLTTNDPCAISTDNWAELDAEL